MVSQEGRTKCVSGGESAGLMLSGDTGWNRCGRGVRRDRPPQGPWGAKVNKLGVTQGTHLGFQARNRMIRFVWEDKSDLE